MVIVIKIVLTLIARGYAFSIKYIYISLFIIMQPEYIHDYTIYNTDISQTA